MILSVIIPAYQCAETLENTVNSILGSGLSDFEIIIIDDGSGDGTAEICDSLAEKHSRIRCVHQENAGVSAARNRGLKEAAGDYVWFFDADDSVDENAMRGAEPILGKDAPDMLVFGLSFDYYHKGKLFRRDELLPPMDGPVHTADCSEKMYELYMTNSLSALWSRIIKRSILLQMDLWLREDMFLYEDLEFSLRIWKRCDSVYFVRRAIYRYRQAEDGGNAGRRLLRVAHIPTLLVPIEAALEGEADKNRILLSLHKLLAREKINVSSGAEIKTVCDDFRSWIDERGLLPAIENAKYPMMMYRGQTNRIRAKRNFGRIRHRVADRLKQKFGDFRKWQVAFAKEGKQ